MSNAKNWIIAAGLIIFLGFGADAIITGQDIPNGISSLIWLILTVGLGAEPIEKLLSKKEGDKDNDK